MIVNQQKSCPIALPALRGFARRLRRAAAIAGDFDVCLCTDAEIRRLNREFRHQDKATDVLSFPAGDGLVGAPDAEEFLGDLAISVETAARQASGLGHSLDEELRILMLHGLLHLTGMDHECDDGEMRRREDELRAVLKLPRGLIARVEAGAESERRRARPAERAPRPAQRRRR